MRRSLCKCLLLLVLFLLPLQVMRAQDDYQYRLEIGAGVGLVAYEGDLNGNILAHQQPMAAIVGRYNFDPYKDLRFNLGLGKLKGSNDKVKTDYPGLDGKAYSFSNTLVDTTSGPMAQAGTTEEPGGWCLSSSEVWEPPL